MKLAARNARRSDPVWVGKRLAKLREQAGLSQDQVAKRMGADRSTPYRMERGKNTQRLDLLAAYCTVVGADLEAVFQVDHVSESDHERPVLGASEGCAVL